MSNWVVKLWRRATDPFPYMILRMDDDGSVWKYGHERYYHRSEAISRAKTLAEQGYRVDVLKDVASSVNLGSDNVWI